MRIARRVLGVGIGSATLLLIALGVPVRVSQAGSITDDAIGVTAKPLSDELRDEWDYRGAGMLVTAVTAGSPAQQAGISRGDLLVVIGSVSLREESDLDKAMSRVQPGVPVSVVIARNEARLFRVVNITLGGDASSDGAAKPPAEGDTGGSPADAAASPPPSGDAAPAVQTATEVAQSGPAVQPARDGYALLGIQCANLNVDLAAVLRVPLTRGVLVLDVIAGGPAERVGIRAGDVITRVGSQDVEDVDHCKAALVFVNGSVQMRVQRQKFARTVELSLESPPVPSAHDATTASAENKDAIRDQIQELRRQIEKLSSQLDGVRSN